MISPWKLGPNLQDFAPLGNLGNSFLQGYDQSQKRAQDNQYRQTLASLGQGGDYDTVGKTLISQGRVQEGAALASLAQKAREQQSTMETSRALSGIMNGGAPNMAQPTAPQPQAPGGLGGAASAISSIESGGRYDAVGPATRTGDRAYGKYQVMGANVGPWTQKYLGRAMTPQEFAASPEAQDAVFQGEFGRLAAKHGPEGAARAWFAGEGGMNDMGRKDVLGTSVADYSRKFNANYQGPAPTAQPVQMAQVQTGVANDAQTATPAREQQLRRALSLPGITDGQRQMINSELQSLREDRRRAEDAKAPTSEQKNLAAINRDRKAQGLPEYRLDEWKLMQAREARSQVNVDMKGETKLAEENSKALGARFKSLAEEGEKAIDDKALIEQLRALSGQIQTGGAAVLVQKAAEFGIKLPGASQVEAYSALIDKLTPQQRLPGSGATSDFDARMFKASLPRLINTPEGNRIIIDTMDTLAENRLRRGEIAGLAQLGEANGGLAPREAFRQLNELQKEAKRLSDSLSKAARGSGAQAPAPAAVQPSPAQAPQAAPPQQQAPQQQFRDGQTATNPQNGQKIIFDGKTGQWVPMT
jgi:hypothetical protein